VLANTAAQIPGPDLWNSRIQSARQTGMDGVAAAAAERWFTKAFRDTNPEKVERVLEMVRTTPLNGYLAACAAGRDMDQREAIRSIGNKVLVIAGRHDLSTPPGMGALVANSIEGAKFITLEASHISNIEDEANFTRAAVAFLTAPETVAVTPRPRRKAPAKKAPAKKAAAKKSLRTKTSSRKQVSAKKAPVKKTSGQKFKTKGLPKKPAAKKTMIGTGSKKRLGKKTGALKKASGRRKS
jgi:hypothetical protein